MSTTIFSRICGAIHCAYANSSYDNYWPQKMMESKGDEHPQKPDCVDFSAGALFNKLLNDLKGYSNSPPYKLKVEEGLFWWEDDYITVSESGCIISKDYKHMFCTDKDVLRITKMNYFDGYDPVFTVEIRARTTVESSGEGCSEQTVAMEKLDWQEAGHSIFLGYSICNDPEGGFEAEAYQAIKYLRARPFRASPWY